jgi:hypothetical protein
MKGKKKNNIAKRPRMSKRRVWERVQIRVGKGGSATDGRGRMDSHQVSKLTIFNTDCIQKMHQETQSPLTLSPSIVNSSQLTRVLFFIFAMKLSWLHSGQSRLGHHLLDILIR